MEDKEMRAFSLTAFFLVTGLCFFLFSKLLLLLDGASLPVFTWIGIMGIAIGSVMGIKSLRQRAE